MKCFECGHTIPDDSVFCQYCGCQIKHAEDEQEPIVQKADMEYPTESILDAEYDYSAEDFLKTIAKIQIEATKEAMTANKDDQPNYESDVDFGLVPEKPVYTLAEKSTNGEREYLGRLFIEPTGEKPKWIRRGSMAVNGVNGMIDIYDVFYPSGQAYKTVYINMYGAKASTSAPNGFTFAKRNNYNASKGAYHTTKKKTDNTVVASGQKKNKSIFRFVIYILLIVILCGGSWFGYNYYQYSSALEQGEFINADRYYQVLPLADVLFASHRDYLNAGILMEEGKVIEAYHAFQKIEGSHVPVAIINKLESLIYLWGQNEYREKNYSSANDYFSAIPDYKRSSDYLLLISCRGDSFSAWTNATLYYDELVKLLSFEDTADIICSRNDLLERFLTAKWEDGANNPLYFELYKDGDILKCRYNLPAVEMSGHYFFNNGLYTVGESSTTGTKFYRFTIVDEDTVIVYCYKDGSTHRLYRQ